VFGALITITEKAKIEGKYLLVIYILSLSILLILGILTLLRLIKRNEVSDDYKDGLDHIREKFKKKFAPKDTFDDYNPITKRRKDKETRKFGGLTHLISALNSIVIAALAGSFLYWIGGDTNQFHDYWWLYANVIAFLILAFIIQYLYIEYREERYKRPTHAGGVVFREEKDGIKYLLITAKEDEDRWVFPKGHLEKAETPIETAKREVLEESGVKIKTKKNVFILRGKYRSNWEDVIEDFFLLEYNGDGESSEKRKIKWLSFEDAMVKLGNLKESLKALKKANKMLKKKNDQVN